MAVALACSLCCCVALAVLAAYLHRQLKKEVGGEGEGEGPKKDNLKTKSNIPDCYAEEIPDCYAEENYYDSINKEENDAEKYENYDSIKN